MSQVGERLRHYRNTCKTKRKYVFFRHLHDNSESTKRKQKSNNEAHNAVHYQNWLYFIKRLLYNLQVNFSVNTFHFTECLNDASRFTNENHYLNHREMNYGILHIKS